MKDLREKLQNAGIDFKTILKIVAVFREAQSNIDMHADGNGHMDLTISNTEIVLTAVDNGPGIPDLEKAFTPGYTTCPGRRWGGGNGLPLIQRIVDRLEVSTGPNGTKLVMIWNK